MKKNQSKNKKVNKSVQPAVSVKAEEAVLLEEPELSKEAKNKIAFIGLIITLIIVLIAAVSGYFIVKTTSNIADINTAGMALRSQLAEWEKDNSPYPNHIEINIKKAYVKDCKVDVNVGFLNQKKTDSDEEVEEDNFKTAYKQIYLEYEAKDFPSEGERVIGGNRFLCYICDDDFIIVVNHTDADNKSVVVKKQGDVEVDDCAISFKGQNITTTYFNFSDVVASLSAQYPTDFSGWKSIDVNEVNSVIN